MTKLAQFSFSYFAVTRLRIKYKLSAVTGLAGVVSADLNLFGGQQLQSQLLAQRIKVPVILDETTRT